MVPERFFALFGEVKDFLDLENQVAGQATWVDILQAGDHVSLNLINVGLDAKPPFIK
jgi:hypothetical protein